MKEFFMAAVPWICIGLAVALFAANNNAKKKPEDSESKSGNYMMEGMCLGMCAGSALGGNWLSFGMLIGMVIGMCIKKK